LSLPFTAARARNCGFRRLRRRAPEAEYVQFVDGDCEVVDGWLSAAVSFLNSHSAVGAVCGRRRERFPEKTIYNWLCDREWEGAPGDVRACGGDVMIRAGALESVDGYREDMIAGEEPELCVRLRAAGWRVWRLPCEMTLHDAAMTQFRQWWMRILRSGYAFAHGASLQGASKERHWVWESRRAWLWAIWVPLACLIASLALGPWGWLAWSVYPVQILRQAWRNSGSARERLTLALFQVLARIPEAIGQMRFMLDRLLARRAHLIEYK
jgi:GT2 family glycosyltransferase